MDITALGGGFLVTAFAHFRTKWNDDKTLSVWGNPGTHVSVTTNGGVFIEAIDKRGAVAHEGGDGEWFYVPIGKEPLRLRYKRLPTPGLSKRELEKARKVVRRVLVCDSPYGLKLPDTLRGSIGWMERKLNDVPKAAREKARLEFGTTTQYGETYPQIEISYDEPEADKEVIARVQIERERGRIAEAKERAQLGALKKKFAEAAE